jgi:sec-independent protein translocase protein TatA
MQQGLPSCCISTDKENRYMPFGIQPIHLIVIAIVALLIFGPQRLPEIGRGIGKALTEFRKGAREMTEGFKEEATKPIEEENKIVPSPIASQPVQSVSQPIATVSQPVVMASQPVAAAPVEVVQDKVFCSQCGAPNAVVAQYCNRCGAKLAAE